MINWKQKLASRKFWALLAGLATSILVLVGADENTITQVAGVIGATGSVAAYIFAEAYVDANRNNEPPA